MVLMKFHVTPGPSTPNSFQLKENFPTTAMLKMIGCALFFCLDEARKFEGGRGKFSTRKEYRLIAWLVCLRTMCIALYAAIIPIFTGQP